MFKDVLPTYNELREKGIRVEVIGNNLRLTPKGLLPFKNPLQFIPLKLALSLPLYIVLNIIHSNFAKRKKNFEGYQHNLCKAIHSESFLPF